MLTGEHRAGARAVATGRFPHLAQRSPGALGIDVQCHAGLLEEVEKPLRQHFLPSIPSHLPIGRDREPTPSDPIPGPTTELWAQGLELAPIYELA